METGIKSFSLKKYEGGIINRFSYESNKIKIKWNTYLSNKIIILIISIVFIFNRLFIKN